MTMRITSALISLLAFNAICRADAAKPTFADDVLPVLRTACLGCHSDDKQKGGLNLATFAATMEGGSSGAVVVPGKPDQSRLYKLAAHSEEPKMPPKADKLADANLEIIKRWIEQGARENSGSKVIVAAPAAAVSLGTVVKGRPAGPPPMPGKLPLDPVIVARRSGAVLALAANPWAPVVAVGGTRQILLYNSDTAELLGVLPFPAGQVNSLRFSRNGKLLLAAGGRGGASGKAALYDLATGKIVVEVGKETDAILSADISSDQSQIVVGSPSKIVRIYSTTDGSMLREIKKHTDWVTAVEFSPDGVLLASGDRNGGLFVWEAQTGREFFSLRGPTAMITDVSWRDDANVLAASSEDGSIRLFEMENGSQAKSWGAHGGGAEAVKFAHDGRLVSTGRDRVTKLWDGNGGQQKAFEAFADLGLRAAITHDGNRVIAGDWTGQVRVWTTADAKQVAKLDANPPTAAERLQRAEKAVADADAKLKLANDALAAAKAAAEKANGELAPLQVAISKAVDANRIEQNALEEAKGEVEQRKVVFTAAQTKESARAVTHAALAEAATKVQDAANKQPQNAELKAQAAKVAEIAKSALGELDTARKAAAAATAAQKTASEKLTALQKTAAATAAAVPVAQAKFIAEHTARKPILDALPAAQARQSAAAAEAEAARKLLEKEKAPPAKK